MNNSVLFSYSDCKRLDSNCFGFGLLVNLHLVFFPIVRLCQHLPFLPVSSFILSGVFLFFPHSFLPHTFNEQTEGKRTTNTHYEQSEKVIAEDRKIVDAAIVPGTAFLLCPVGASLIYKTAESH